MKIKNGFITNSSSTCFLLDYDNERAKRMIDDLASQVWFETDYEYDWDAIGEDGEKGVCTESTIEHRNHEYQEGDVGRSSFICHGLGWIETLIALYEEWDWTEPTPWMKDIYEKAKKLEHPVFIMCSDEGMGGTVPYPSARMNELSLREIDYH